MNMSSRSTANIERIMVAGARSNPAAKATRPRAAPEKARSCEKVAGSATVR